jgi:multidrug efflux pump subunit AcrB
MVKYLVSCVFIFTIINSSFFPNKAIAEWAYSFVVWEGYTYVVSDEYVTEVDKLIGKVTIYSSIEGTYSGNFSNAYKEGTKYFSIKSIDTGRAIAIQESDGKYIRANRNGEYEGAINDKDNYSIKAHKNKDLGANANIHHNIGSNFSILVFLFLLVAIFGFPLLKRKI